MNIVDEINQKVWKLWEEEHNDKVYVPLIYPNLEPKPLLFIGSNPSFSVKGFLSFIKGTQFSNIDPNTFFHWSNRDEFRWKDAQNIEELARRKYSFFAPFRDIAKDISGDCHDWNHIDLFFCRETNQNSLKNKVYPKNKLSEFGCRQLVLSKKLIIEAKPKVIVVANAFASDLFKEEVFKKEMSKEIDKERGCHLLRVDERIIPVFLASMLTGQRAMDRYSLQRLKWHIKKCYETLNKQQVG